MRYVSGRQILGVALIGLMVGCAPGPQAVPTAPAGAPPAAVSSPAATAQPKAAPSPAAKPAASPSPRAAASPSPVAARPPIPTFDEAAVASFYRGKTIRLLVASSAGGGYDAYARLLAGVLGKHVPGNPNVIVENLPGGGGLLMPNQLFNVEPKDGTVIGAPQNTAPLAELVKTEGVNFKSSAFQWLGSLNREYDLCVVRSDRGITSFREAMGRELRMGGSGPGSVTDQEVQLLNGLLGTRFRLASGYPGTNEIAAAIERGEIDGRCGWSYSSIKTTRPQWLEGNPPFIRLLAHMALDKHPELPDVPLAQEFTDNEDEKAIFRTYFSTGAFGRPYMAPPGVPAERVAALQAAVAKAVEDPELRQRAQQARFDIDFLNGPQVQELVTAMFSQPEQRIERLAKILAS